MLHILKLYFRKVLKQFFKKKIEPNFSIINTQKNKFLFGQQHFASSYFFEENLNMQESPHYKYLENENNIYEKYLINSWTEYYKIPTNKIKDKIKNYTDLKVNIKKTRNNIVPVKLVRDFDNNYIVWDGNHRVCICIYEKIPLRAKIYSPEYYISQIIKGDEFYASGNRGIPYQSIYRGGEILLNGRRTDLYERIEMMDLDDLENKSVVDFGCNLGMSLAIACEKGALDCLGLEMSSKIVTSAIRINVILKHPIRFQCADLSINKKFRKKYDTVFAFSIDKHVKNDKILASNILNTSAKVLYLETHSNSDIPNEIKKISKKINLKGKTAQNRLFYKILIK